MKIRIGGVPYGVGATLLCGLGEEPSVELIRDAPSRLVEPLRKGKLDAALLSSIEAFRHPGYGTVPGIAIASDGPARSVRAFKRPGTVRTVGVDERSESSVALLRILLDRRLGAPDCQFERIEPTTEPDALPHDLVLLIGDHGLRADAGTREVLDLGDMWWRWQGEPFVYALWLIAPHADAEAITSLLQRAQQRGEQEAIDDGTGGAIYYRLGPRELTGLARFRNEAARLGLADAAIDLEVISDEDARASS